MKKSLDSIVFASFILIFSGVLAIGGASLHLVRNMMGKTAAIAEEGHNVDFINQLHNKIYSLIFAIHHQMLHISDEYPQQTRDLIKEIDLDIEEYIKHEESSTYPESDEEVRLLIGLRCALLDLERTPQMTQNPQGSDPLDHMDELLERHAKNIQEHVHRINQIHFKIIARKVAANRVSMSLLLYLYGAFSIAGLSLLYLGYRLHSRNVVIPIKQLAAASERVAEGNLNERVCSDSETEIGVLCKSFNGMVERLQSHEKELRSFNLDLEEKVKARTCELEAAHADLLRFEKMAMLGQIATSVNHEVRTPLNALSMNVQLIRRMLEQSSAGISNERRTRQNEIMDRIALIDQEVSRISDMLEEFVRYARFSPPVMVEVDLNKVVGYVADMVNERAQQSGVALKLSLADPAPKVQADENKLIQALVNLCTNAFHAMPEGGVLDLATEVGDDAVEIFVADTGSGIPEEDQGKIFQPFFTNKATGLGFGLSIVQRIVEGHGGRISCRSRIGEGTVFTIHLPLNPNPENGDEDGRIAADRR